MTMMKILLIDDDILEEEMLKRAVKRLNLQQDITIQHVFKCSEAINHLLLQNFDLVLLDNLLASSISGKFSVLMIKQYIGDCQLAIISNNVDVDYLEDPKILGVDKIVAKIDLNDFVLKFFRQRKTVSNKPIETNRPTHSAA